MRYLRISRDSDMCSQMGRRKTLGTPGTLNSVTPCAACKLLRRRCAEECLFSPYFSPHEPQRFAAVHKVFGASNVSKMIMEVPASQRADAANSLVYEANLRLRDPVYGSVGAISALQQQIRSLQAELNALNAEIIKYKYKEASDNTAPVSHGSLISSGAVSMAISLPGIPSAPPPPSPSPPPSIVAASSSSSSMSTFYTQPSNTMGYNCISSSNISYFD